MSLTRKQITNLKKTMINKDQDSLAKIRRNKSVVIKKSVIKEEFKSKKSVVRWNFKVNDLVNITFGENQFGLIVSDFEYFSKRVEKNCFFVLVNYTVKMYDGKYLRQI
jgi:hypothetical protein